jgi:hypothetical protein
MRQTVRLAIPFLAAAALTGCREPAKLFDIKPRDARPDEVGQALAGLPKNFREGLTGTDAEIARQLGLQAWAYDFTGGPFGAWIDIEEEGQQTAKSPMPKNGTMRLNCDAEAGVLLFWLQPRTTRDMSPELKKRMLADKPPVPNLFIGLTTNGKPTLDLSRYDNPDQPIEPLWFGWKLATVETDRDVATLKDGQEKVILEIRATEANTPRKAKLVLTVVK